MDDGHMRRLYRRRRFCGGLKLVCLEALGEAIFRERFLMRAFKIFSVAVLLCGVPSLGQTTAAATPPMGWNSWNHFAGRVTDADVRSAADSLVATGMRDAGY